MNHQHLADMLRKFNCNEPAHDADIAKFETEHSIQLPSDYADFLRYANGGEGFVGTKSYVILWAIEEVVKMNDGYKVNQYAPGMLLIGSDGGGEGYAIDLRGGSAAVVSVPFVGMSTASARVIGQNFGLFLESLAQS